MQLFLCKQLETCLLWKIFGHSALNPPGSCLSLLLLLLIPLLRCVWEVVAVTVWVVDLFWIALTRTQNNYFATNIFSYKGSSGLNTKTELLGISMIEVCRQSCAIDYLHDIYNKKYKKAWNSKIKHTRTQQWPSPFVNNCHGVRKRHVNKTNKEIIICEFVHRC